MLAVSPLLIPSPATNSESFWSGVVLPGWTVVVLLAIPGPGASLLNRPDVRPPEKTPYQSAGKFPVPDTVMVWPVPHVAFWAYQIDVFCPNEIGVSSA